MTTERLLIVNADEFGRSAGINRGVVEAHLDGILTSASAMVTRPAAAQAAQLARKHSELGVGLQVDLCEWVHRDGRWVQVEEVVPLSDGEAVSREIRSQVARFRTLFGRDPTHLDSHQSVHRSEPVRSAFLAVAERLEVPLRQFAQGIFVCSEFHGHTSRGRPYREGITVDRLLSVLRSLPPGATELICHPGHADDANGPYDAEREVELRVLRDPRVRREVQGRGIRLTRFPDLGAAGRVDAHGLEPSFRERGRAAFERGEFRDAARWFRRAVEVGGDRPWPWLWLARAELRSGDREASREAIDRGLRILPNWPRGLLHVADLHLDAGEIEKAANVLARVAADGPRENGNGDGVVRAVAGRIRRFPDPHTALRVAEALLGTYPDEAEALAAKAAALARVRHPEKVESFLDSLSRVDAATRDRAMARFHLAGDEPLAAWDHLCRIPLRERDAPLVAGAARGLRRGGELTRAWEAFDLARELGGDGRSTAHWHEVVRGEVQVLSGAWRPRGSPVRHYEGRPGRVLHLVGKSLPFVQTGYSLRTRYITLAQRQAGQDPEVVTQIGFPWDQGLEEASLREDPDAIPHHRLPGPHPLPARLDRRMDLNLDALRCLVRRRRPSILHAHSDYRNALLALGLRDTFGIPVIYEVRGFWEETWCSKQASDAAKDAVAYRWRRERELTCMQRADCVVTLAEVMKETLMERGVAEEKIHVIPNAVDANAFRPMDRDPALAGRLGIHEDEVVLGYVSSFTPYEGIHFLIEAVAALVRKGLPVRGLLVGDGEERPHLEARARELGVADRIVFTGRVPHDEVAALYGLIDIFVVPRTGDRVSRLVTPLKPYEAMAMERAVVVSGVEALREMVLAGKTGLTFRPEDPRDLARVVEPLVRSRRRRRELGRAARLWVSTHRTWQHNGPLYAELIESLTSRDEPRETQAASIRRRPVGRPGEAPAVGAYGRV